MDTNNEMIELRPSGEEHPPGRLGKLETLPPEPEVGGRGMTTRLARCGSCGHVGYLSADPAATRAYSCTQCGKVGMV